MHTPSAFPRSSSCDRCLQLPVSATCAACGRPLPLDDIGVLRLTSTDEPWLGVPARVGPTVLSADDRADLIDAMLDGPDRWSPTLQRRLLHPASGVAATLVEPVPGRMVLDLGTGWGGLAPALRTFGNDVVRADWVYARLRFAHLFHTTPNALAVHLGLGERLPWPTGHFDLAFVDLGELDRSCAGRRDGAEVRDHLLREVYRVLAADGIAVIGTHNALRGRLDGGSGPPDGEDVRRTAAEASRSTFAAWRALRSPSGERGLRKVGLLPVRSLVPRPKRADWKTIVGVEDLSAHLAASTHARGLRGRASRALTTAGLSKWLTPDYFVVVRPAPATGTGTGAGAPGSASALDPAPSRTLAEALMAPAGPPPPVIRALSDARIAVTGPVLFAKVPLSSDQERALVNEVENTITARTTSFAPFVLDGALMRAVSGVPCASYPMIVERSRAAGDAQIALHAALSAMDTGSTAPVDATVHWRRLTGPRGRSDAAETGATLLREMILDTCGKALVPVGPTHGDLHTGNVLFPVGGSPLLVDWNRFELFNPLLLDAAYAAVRTHMSASGQSLADALIALVDSQIPGPLADISTKRLGQLDSYQAASILLLDRVVSYSLPRRAHKPWTIQPWWDAAEALTARIR